MAGMRYLRQKVDDDEQVKIFADLSIKYKDNIKKKKKRVSLLSLKSATAMT